MSSQQISPRSIPLIGTVSLERSMLRGNILGQVVFQVTTYRVILLIVVRQARILVVMTILALMRTAKRHIGGK
jgi:hypothetical protein